MHCLKIHIHSFQLCNDLVRPNDKVRVSITTLPERNKQAFVIEAKNIHNINHVFSVNITEQTVKIILVIRKKSFILADPIISSTIINSSNFLKLNSNINCTNPSYINLYENLHNQPDKKISDRRIIGSMKLSYTISDELQDKKTHELMFSKLSFFKNNENRYNKDMIYSIMIIDDEN